MITIIKKKTEGNHNYNVYNIIIIIVFRHCLMQLEIIVKIPSVHLLC